MNQQETETGTVAVTRDGKVRHKRAAASIERILKAGADLARGMPTWEWSDLTFQAVADRAGLSVRTVYRHFPNERELHAAIRRRLEQDVGVHYEDDIALAELPEREQRVFDMLMSFAARPWSAGGPPRWSAHHRRIAGIHKAVAAAAPDAPPRSQDLAAAMLDIIWSVPAFERMVEWSHLDPDEAARTMRWAHDLLVGAIERGELPAAKRRRTRR